MKGYIWYHEKIYGGAQEEYVQFCEKHEDVELVMALYDTTPEKLKTIADNLNRSNFIDHLKGRDKKN